MSWTITPQTKVPVDPVFNNVSLLLHGNGTNGSTTITDSSSSPKTVTAVGNAQISTAQSKFGGASIAFDGNGDWLTVANAGNIDFGSGPFTVESWIYQTQNTAGYAPILISNGSNNGGMGFLVDSTRGLSLYWNNFKINSTATKYSLNQWNHLAWARESSGLVTIYLNGVSAGAGSAIGSPTFNDIRIGANPSDPISEIFLGYIDDLRITKGVARYETGTGANAGKMVFAGTNTLALPTAPFPDI